MNISTNINKPKIELVNPKDVPRGKVYSWGARTVSYLRVEGGSVCLSNCEFIPEVHPHFTRSSGYAQVADKADLTITYEG